MSELSQEEKRQAFIKKAKENKAKFDMHIALKDEIFGNVEPTHLQTIIENGAMDDMFSLLLLEYGEAYHEFKLEQLNLPVVSVPQGTLLCRCGLPKGNAPSCMSTNCDSLLP